MSEAELHSLRLRLDAGRLSKAKRGELVHHPRTGLVRTDDKTVIFDPDVCVQDRIRLVFQKYMELGTAGKVLHYLVHNNLKLPRCQRSGLYAGQTLWKDPSVSALYSILKNPAYAGAFAYGRRCTEPTRQIPGRPATGKIRRSQSEWLALVKDAYPAYITWEEHEKSGWASVSRFHLKLHPLKPKARLGSIPLGAVQGGDCLARQPSTATY
jgi:hypothetical protein